MSQEMTLSLINAAYEKHGSDQRVAECFSFALPAIEDNNDPYGVEDEWLDYWKVHASMARQEDAQAIWGGILAGEINKPGSVSKHAMSILADMEREDAESFSEYCSKCVMIESAEGLVPTWPCPSSTGIDEKLSSVLHINPTKLMKLQSLGLISNGEAGYAFQLDGSEALIIEDNRLVLERIPGRLKNAFVPLGDSFHFILTQFGRGLAPFCGVGTINGLRSEVEKALDAYGVGFTQK